MVDCTHKPGTGAELLRLLAKEKINVAGMCAYGMPDGRAFVHIACDDIAKAKRVLKKAGRTFRESQIIAVSMANKPGTYASILEKVGKAGVNVEYAYATGAGRNGTGYLFFSKPEGSDEGPARHQRSATQIAMKEGGLAGSRAILGIDAAWVDHNQSGFALANESSSGWNCVALAPSCEAFLNFSKDAPIDWRAKSTSGIVAADEILAASNRLAPSSKLLVVAVDMPLACVPITRRRAADEIVSRAYGDRGCAVHSPTPDRPGRLARRIRESWMREGFHLATATTSPRHTPALVEVYPHPALLTLMGRDYRLMYKWNNRQKYWPGATAGERRQRITCVWKAILHELRKIFSSIPLQDSDIEKENIR
ncbi:MAG: DUF429 domain-containing protein [Deltaproteobacteria bacterium]|nr:DUF429 domain-containing protein [Deltaproteobacteria bacterium]